MDKGIRAYARNKFVEQNELRRRNLKPYDVPKANTVFRKNIVFDLIEQFGCSVASACTHYNEAFKLVKEATPELVAGLGREEDKKGGRKRKEQPAVQQPSAASLTQEETVQVLLEHCSTPHAAAEAEEVDYIALSAE